MPSGVSVIMLDIRPYRNTRVALARKSKVYNLRFGRWQLVTLENPMATGRVEDPIFLAMATSIFLVFSFFDITTTQWS